MLPVLESALGPQSGVDAGYAFKILSVSQSPLLLVKTNVDGSKVIRKLSRYETRQIEKYKKMSKAEKKMFAVKHVNCFHRCVPPILKEMSM